MSVAPFQPVREDGRPYWQVIYDELVARIERDELKEGDTIPHGTLSDLLDGIPHYQATTKAAQHLREHHGRSLKTVRGLGYKLVAGMAQARQATDLQHKSQRTLVRATSVASTVDHSLLSPDERSTVTQMAIVLDRHSKYLRMTVTKLAEHEQEIELLKSAKVESNSRLRATVEDMAELRRQLDEDRQQRDEDRRRLDELEQKRAG